MNRKIMAGVIGLLAVISGLQAQLNKTTYEVARESDLKKVFGSLENKVYEVVNLTRHE